MRLEHPTYHRPQTLDAACELGRVHGRLGRFLAGGTELLVDLKSGRDAAETLISLRDLPELRRIHDQDGWLSIGSMASLADVAASDLVRERFPVLAEAVLAMGGVQIRNQATIGGNFCRAVPCADTPPVCIAGEATVRIVGVETDRVLPAQDLFLAPRHTALSPGELLIEIRVPPQPAGSAAAYERFSLRRGMALAVAAVAARVTMRQGRIEEARIALNAVCPVPVLATAAAAEIVGREPDPERLAAAGRAAAAAAQPITDIRGSADFRRELVAVLTPRALARAVARATGGQS